VAGEPTPSRICRNQSFDKLHPQRLGRLRGTHIAIRDRFYVITFLHIVLGELMNRMVALGAG